MKNQPLVALLILATATMLSSCQTSDQPEVIEELPPAHTSPLGIDQPDPQALAQSAIDAYRQGKVWAFLSHFGFIDAKTGKYYGPANVKEDPFYGSQITELRPLAQSLFPLRRTKTSRIVFGTPVTVRNRPLIVEVPYSVSYDFSQLTDEERRGTMKEVNTALASQGQPAITFEEYAKKVSLLPKESRHRFIYQKKRWFIDGGTWHPYRVKKGFGSE